MAIAERARRRALPERLSPGQPRKQQHSLFSVIGEKLDGHALALIIATTEADAEYYALHELGFVTVSEAGLVSDCVYVGLVDIKG